MTNWYQSHFFPQHLHSSQGAMVDGTRFKTLDDNQRRLESEVQDMKVFMTSTSKFISDSHQHREDQRKQMEEIKKQLQQLTEAVSNSSNQNPASKILNVGEQRNQREVDDRTLLIKIHLELYSISWEVLDQIFSRFGVLEYLEVFAFGGDYHSKIRLRNKESAIEAFNFLNNRDIYNGCCQLELFWASSVESSSSKQEGVEQCHEIDEDAEVTLNLAFDDSKAKFIGNREEIKVPIEELGYEIINLKESNLVRVNGCEGLHSDCEFLNSLVGCTLFRTLNLDLEITSLNKVLYSSETLGTGAHAFKVFEVMPEMNFVLFEFSVELEHSDLSFVVEATKARPKGGPGCRLLNANLTFDPGIANLCNEVSGCKSLQRIQVSGYWVVPIGSRVEGTTVMSQVFDPGGFCLLLVSKKCYAEILEASELVNAGGIVVFDPGGGVHILRNEIFCVESPFAMLLIDRLILVFDPGGNK